MGEAKTGEAGLRARVIIELERHMVPASPAEARLNEEIREMQFYSISRVPADVLAYMRMEPQRCHLNAAAYERLDPSGDSRHVGGWWKRRGIFYFHSVILTQTRLRCVTPHADRSKLEFAPDFDILWSEIGGARRPRRHGDEPPVMVRDFPEAVIAQATEARDRIMAGAHPKDVTVPF